MQSADSIETYCIWDKERSSKWKRRDQMYQYNKTIQKMINFDDVT